MPTQRSELLRSGLVSLLIGFILLAIITGGTIWFVQAELHNREATRHAVNVQARLTDLLSLLQDAETGQRGFLLTGSDAYLVPYAHAIETIPGMFDSLQMMLADHPAERAALANLRGLADAKLAELASTIVLFRSGHADQALQVVRSGDGKTVMDQVRTAIMRLSTDEDRQVIERRAQAFLAGERLQLCVVAAGILLAVVAASTFWIFLRQIRHVTASRDALNTAHARLLQETTQREQVEDQLRQSQKMEALGQLTGGLAHDLNNMLAVIIGSLSLLERRRARGEAGLQELVDAAMEAAQRAAALTHRLLAFSRRQSLSPQVIDVNRLVAGMSDLLRRTLGVTVQLETILGGGLWRTHADASQLESTLLNLTINSRDAMPEGGHLTIETANAHLDDQYAAMHADVPSGQYVLIAVTDNGVGMSPDVTRKAFDPFFTTKGVGKGTGLGLSQVYGFVKQSNGHVKIYSEVGHGTTVKLYLPRFFVTESPTPENHPHIGSLSAIATGNETILVVEDEERVRRTTVESVRELGYTVLEADGALAALRIIDSRPEITLVFTDIIMPEVNGRRFAEQALHRRPGLRVLYTTGYTRNAIVHNGVLDPGVQLLSKPYTLEQLALKLREVLDAPAAVAGDRATRWAP